MRKLTDKQIKALVAEGEKDFCHVDLRGGGETGCYVEIINI